MKMVLKKYGPVWSNTDSGSKIRVQCYRDTTTLYLAFILET